MATIKERWQCDLCETIHPTLEQAQKCEAEHITTIEVAAATYARDMPLPYEIFIDTPEGRFKYILEEE